MNEVQLRIIKRAVTIRVERGEDIDLVLDGFPKLTQKEREDIKAEILGK